MANVYSILMADSGGPQPAGTRYSSTVPSGYVWDVRSIVCGRDTYSFTFTNGFQVRVRQTGTLLLSLQQPFVTSNVSYRYEMREILSAGQSLEFDLLDTSWWYRVNGYQLTLP